MKKLASFLVVCTVAVASLASCNDSNEKEKKAPDADTTMRGGAPTRRDGSRSARAAESSSTRTAKVLSTLMFLLCSICRRTEA